MHFFGENLINTIAIDNSFSGIKIINEKIKKSNLSKYISTQVFDIRKKLPFEDNSLDACYSHMLYCMALTDSDLENLNKEIWRVLKPNGLNIYTVRNTLDGDYKNGILRGENLYENDGFIIHFFSKDKVNQLLNGFKNLKIENFEEGSFPRKLFIVINKKI
ncbi:methyltransferase domain-containing protein [Candidatus Pelagibacter sp.]|nr:methyltransferase domain-containing protein [Candidatus Pelagibacter sp.]